MKNVEIQNVLAIRHDFPQLDRDGDFCNLLQPVKGLSLSRDAHNGRYLCRHTFYNTPARQGIVYLPCDSERNVDTISPGAKFPTLVCEIGVEISPGGKMNSRPAFVFRWVSLNYIMRCPSATWAPLPGTVGAAVGSEPRTMKIRAFSGMNLIHEIPIRQFALDEIEDGQLESVLDFQLKFFSDLLHCEELTSLRSELRNSRNFQGNLLDANRYVAGKLHRLRKFHKSRLG
jgi:hypothetical protein